MIKFLSSEHYGLMNAMMPQVVPFSQHRFSSYLSFYLSFSSKHLYYTPQLLSSHALQQYFNPQFKSTQLAYSINNINTEQLLARQLLGINFQQHILDEQGVLRWYSDIHKLLAINKKDIIEEFAKSKCRVDSSNRIKVMSQINPNFRRTFYIAFKGDLPDSNILEQKLTMNPFYQLKNTNKVLFFGENAHTSLHLPLQLQKFCKEFDIKIKLLKNNSLKGIIEYLYLKSKKNILLHENINGDKSIYEFDVQKGKKKQKQSKQQALSLRLAPQAIMVLTQRLPKQTLVKDNKDDILKKMKTILNVKQHQNLINQNSLDFTQLEKRYIYEIDEEEDDQPVQGKYGFTARQYVTQKVYERNRADQVNRGNPFSENKAKKIKSK